MIVDWLICGAFLCALSALLNHTAFKSNGAATWVEVSPLRSNCHRHWCADKAGQSAGHGSCIVFVWLIHSFVKRKVVEAPI